MTIRQDERYTAELRFVLKSLEAWEINIMSKDQWISDHENITERIGDDLHSQGDVREALRELGIWGQEADDEIEMILEDHPDLPECDRSKGDAG